MDIVVQKYGGSSLSTPEKILALAEGVARRAQGQERLVLVVSAMGDATDQLIALAHKVSPHPPAREMDMLMATGEQVSIALMAMALNRLGARAISYTGPQIGLRTSPHHMKARVTGVKSEKVMKELADGKIVIVAGFQGVTEDEDVTTLGRGGSDISAMALAVALNARVMEKYTDRDGVFTADPRVHPGARRIPRLSYEEMLEMSFTGAKILNPRAVFFAWKYKIPILIRESLGDGEGTLIDQEGSAVEEAIVSGVTQDLSVAKITVYNVPDQPGSASRIFSSLSERDVPVDMIVQATTESATNNISFTVLSSDLKAATEALESLKSRMPQIAIKASPDVARISLVGLGIRTDSQVAAHMFQALSDEGINIQMIGTSDVRISCIIAKEEIKRAVHAVSRKFKL